jgi:hypothetical protein
MPALASADAGLVHRCRSMIRQRVPILAHAHSEAQATLRLPQRRQAIHAMEAPPLEKIPHCFDAHWEQALRFSFR